MEQFIRAYRLHSKLWEINPKEIEVTRLKLQNYNYMIKAAS